MMMKGISLLSALTARSRIRVTAASKPWNGSSLHGLRYISGGKKRRSPSSSGIKKQSAGGTTETSAGSSESGLESDPLFAAGISATGPTFGKVLPDFAKDIPPPTQNSDVTNKVVIFDKDGTLICFHSMWTPWMLDTAAKIETASGLGSHDIANAVFDLLGFCPKDKKFRPGLLAEATMPQIQGKVMELLMIHGMEEHEARHVVSSVWESCDTTSGETLKTLHNIKALFESLKQHGFKIAVSTADSRDGTESTLEKLGLWDLVDVVVCGDDKETMPKPNPANALAICKALNVDPENAYMVGDTIADVGMGKTAKLGGSIGVLSGVATAQDLEPFATHLIPDVGSVLPVVLEKENEMKKKIPYSSRPTARKGAAAARKVREYLEKYGGNDAEGMDLEKKLVSDTQTDWRKPKPINPNDIKKRSYHTLARRFTPVGRPVENRLKLRNSTTTRGVFGPPPSDVKATHIIVGAGSAGCVLANRLSENPDHKVLLLEAGPPDKWYNWKIHMPAALMYNLCDDKYNWYYHTVPQEHMNNRVMYWPRGRVLGGSSSLNAMVYIRGHALDYDRWGKQGATGWSYSTCLPYFKKSETYELGENDYHGGAGPLKVSRAKCDNPLYHAFIDAGVEAGLGYTEDQNGYRQEGVGPMDFTINNGKRCNTSQAYLMPAIDRPNLFVVTNALTTSVMFNGKQAVGVRYCIDPPKDEPIGNANLINAYAEQDVILCGGAINSPHLLLLSGVGPPEQLYRLSNDIKMIHPLPGVGQNLQDHLEVYVQHACTQPITLYDRSSWKFPLNMIKTGLEWFMSQTGDGASNHLESGGFCRTGLEGVEHPDIQFHFLPSAVYDHGRVTGDQHAYQVHVGPLRAESRGEIVMRRSDPRVYPELRPNYMSTERDRAEFRAAIRIAREVFAQKAFDPFRGEELAPGPDIQTDEELDEFVRAKGDSAYHPSCTCKMGDASDPMAVVDPLTMKVHVWKDFVWWTPL